MTYKEVLKSAQRRCEDQGIGEQVALMLLLELSNTDAHSLYMEYEQEISEDLLKKFNDGIDKLMRHVPLAHVLGYEYFYGYQFLINEEVLIPRPETEELVVNVLSAYDECFSGQDVEVIDVGCGSGAISIALQLEESHFHVSASDISEGALKIAKKNAKKLNSNVTFLQGNMLDPFIEQGKKVDILVSNPPYIPINEQMEKSVVDFEPHVALFGGEDGLFFYKEIFKNAHKVLNEKSVLAFEIGYDQKEKLINEASIYFPNDKIEVLQDLNGKNRMLFIYRGMN